MTREQEQDWIFTFGFAYEYGPNTYAVFHGTRSTAREQMFKAYGSEWAFQYPDEKSAGVKRFNLRRIN